MELIIKEYTNVRDKEYFWDMFKQHHYLSSELNMGARVFVGYLNDIPVALCAVRPEPGRWRNQWIGTRTVVLPDYQGLGIGPKMILWSGELISRNGGLYKMKTANRKLIKYFTSHTDLWRATVTEQKLYKFADAYKFYLNRKDWWTEPANIDPMTYTGVFKFFYSAVGGGARFHKFRLRVCGKTSVRAYFNGYDYMTKHRNYYVFENDESANTIDKFINENVNKNEYNYIYIGNCGGGYAYAETICLKHKIRSGNRLTHYDFPDNSTIIYVHSNNDNQEQRKYLPRIDKEIILDMNCGKQVDNFLF